MAIDVEQLRKDRENLSKDDFDKKYEMLKGLTDEQMEKVVGGAWTVGAPPVPKGGIHNRGYFNGSK